MTSPSRGWRWLGAVLLLVLGAVIGLQEVKIALKIREIQRAQSAGQSAIDHVGLDRGERDPRVKGIPSTKNAL